MEKPKPEQLRIVKPLEISRTKTQLGFADEVLLNDALSRMNTALRMIDNHALAENYYCRVKNFIAEFEKKWGLGDKIR